MVSKKLTPKMKSEVQSGALELRTKTQKIENKENEAERNNSSRATSHNVSIKL